MSQEPPLCGRSAELARLTRICVSPSSAPRVVEISGDPWIGKTRLLGALEWHARDAGWTVASGAAGPLPADLPFGVFADALDDLLSGDGAAPLRGVAPDHRRWLAGLFPALASGAAQAAVPVGASERYHAHRAVRTLLETLAGSRRLLLTLDDVHWMDEASVHLLRYLLRHPPDGDVLIAVAHRPRQVDPGLHEQLGDAAAAGRGHRIDLPPLTRRDAASLFPTGINEFRRLALYKESGGVPGLLQALVAAERAARPGADTADAPVVTLRDFRATSALSWLVAKGAALLSEPVDVRLLAEMVQLTEAEVWTGIDELLRNDVFRMGAGDRGIRFRNRCLRAAAHRAAGPGWRLWMHTRAAAVLRRQGASSRQIASHLAKGSPARGEADARALIDAARGTLWDRPDWAAAWAESARDLLVREGHRPQDEGELIRAQALAVAGRPTRSLGVLARLRLAVPEIRAEAAVWRARVLCLIGRPLEAFDALRDVPADAAADPEPALAWLAAAIDLGRAGEEPCSIVPHASGPTWAEPATFLRARLLTLLGCAASAAGRTGIAEPLIDEASDLVDELPDDVIATGLEYVDRLVRIEDLLGRRKSAIGHAERALGLAERRYLHTFEPVLATTLGSLLLHAEDLPGASYHAAQAEYAARRDSGTYFLAGAGRLRMEIDRRDRMTGAGTGAGSVRSEVEAAAGDGGLERLSNRETEIAMLVSAGRTNQQIARALGVSHKTVETHLARMFKKLEVGSRAQIAALVGQSRTAPHDQGAGALR